MAIDSVDAPRKYAVKPEIDLEISTPEKAREIGLSPTEYAHVCKHLERRPNFAELSVFSAMFSEHCSYKSSKKYLSRFPTKGKRVLQGPGENAGVVSIGQGWAVAFKMESHNHPSFIEPYQGAATGMGGILRDVFTMGARPIASMNSLCFGTIANEKMRSVVKGVVKGIGDYGNCMGVPTIAGQTFFHPCYNANPLVNAFTLGILREDKIFLGYASGIGNAVVYVGAKTGRDGVHGATMASKEFSTEKELDRPTVQVGDPFTEKLLLEATLEAMDLGLIVGIQDMGAAGLTSSCFEMAERAGTGVEIDLNKIPTRESGMHAFELLLSESQERMLLVTTPDKLPRLFEVFDKWDLHSETIGTVVEGNRVKMTLHGELVVDLPVDLVTKPLMADHPKVAPGDLKQRWFLDRNRLMSATTEAKFNAVFDDLNFGDVSPITLQYDSMVGNRTVGGTFDDAAVLRLREVETKTLKLAFSVDCNPRVCWLWPREGGRRAIAEAATNLATRWAEPIGVTDCLNFGSPENPEVMWQFEEAIEGISETCEALKIPVISGNVSFYNETDGRPIYPTPMIGMVGLIEDDDKLPYTAFYRTDLEIGLVGTREPGLGGTVLSSQWFKRDCGKPDETDLNVLDRTLKFLARLKKKRFQTAIHDLSDGGLVAAALEMCFRSPIECLGFELLLPSDTDVDKFLFGESVPRILVAYEPVERTEIENLANGAGVPFTALGSTNDAGCFIVKQGGATILNFKISDLKERWQEKYRAYFE
jgi:phosphoribosylformylglycinamidine synthase II